MNILREVTDKFISRMSANLLRIGLLLPAFLLSSVTMAAEPVCAVVKIEIQQELSLERQAFDATMRINNGLDLLSLENVTINVNFKDETGASVEATSDTNSTTAKFFIKVDSMSGINDIYGFGTVAPKTTAEVHWLIIPAPGSGGDKPSGKLYFVGATLSYNLGGELQTTTVTPDTIYVKPLPLLTLDYFLERDVHADDPFTAEVEPAVPFTLGVRVKNNGAASATGLKIDSAQPEIVENEQGLLIGFNIIGSNVNEQATTNSLLIDFGEIKPNEASMGRWDMVTTLSGRFTEFTADFSHADDLGGRLTSIIDPAGINTHTLVRNVLVDVTGRDFVRDFLAYDNPTTPVYRVYESSGVDTDVTDVSASSTLTVVSGGTEPSLSLTMPVTAGFSYAKLKDPFAGTKVVKQMVRSDGKTIPLDNAWTSKTRNLDDPNNPGWDYFINFFDANTTGTYALLMGVPDLGPVPPEFTPLNNVTTYETATLTFPVSALDPNGDAVSLFTGTLPNGATFTSDTSGSGTFSWIPAVGQAGDYTITFTASDGTLTKDTTVNIKVNPVDDTDGDGLNDDWERLHFGDLSRDGTADLDGDGISDLQEYLDQTDPNLDPPLVPTNLVALPGNAENTLNWDTVTGVDSYNVYWSLTADVTPTTGTLVNATTVPFVHTGLDNDVTYYYIVTSVGAGGESAESNMVSVTTGVRDWAAPVSLQSNSTATFTPLNARIAMAANGDAIAVWQQTDNGLNSIWSARYKPLSGWTTPAVISDITLDSSAAQIAMDADGNAIAVWQQVNTAQTDVVATHFDVLTNTWSTVAAIEADDTAAAVNPQIVISQAGTNAGNALVVWQQGATIMSNTFAAQAWQTTATVVSTESVTDLSQLILTMNDSGNAFAAWVSTADQTNYDLRVNKFINSAWDATTVTLATGLDNWLQPAIDMNASGNAVMAWPAFNGTRHVMMASQYDVSTGWAVAEPIESALIDPNTGEARTPQVAMDSNGNAFVVWSQSGSPFSVYVNRLDANLGFAVTATLIETRERGDASNPQLVIDNRGNAVVSWQQADGVQQNIIAAVYDNTSSTWGAESVIETSNSGDAVAPAMAVSESGNVIVVWQQAKNNELTIAANHYAVGNNGVPNIAPVAVAGTDQTVNEQTAVTLDGSASFDQDSSGLISTYSWTQTAGNVVTLTGETTATPGFTAPTLVTAETLSFELTVTDEANATSTKTVNVIVNPVNAAPVANAGLDQTINEQTIVNLSAAASSDSDGSIATYNWTQVVAAGQTAVAITGAATATPSFTAPTVFVQDGDQVLTFNVEVTDNEGGVHSDTVLITVQAVNVAPVANAGVAQTVNEQTVVNLSAEFSADSDGLVAGYNWTQVVAAGQTPVAITGATTATPSFTAPSVLVQDGDQVLTFNVEVTDNEGATHNATVAITVQAVNTAPVANAGAAQTVNEQTVVNLSAALSSDSDGSIASYNWTQVLAVGETPVAITAATTATPSFTAPIVLVQDGDQVLTFNVEVTDNEGATHTAQVTVTVQAVNTIPVANAGAAQTVNEQTLVNLTAAASSDSDGSIASYNWTHVPAVGQTPIAITAATTATPSFTAPIVLVQDGDQLLTFNVQVTDNEGATHTDTVVITVQAVNANPVANAGIDQTVNEQTLVNLTAVASTDSDGSIASYNWSHVPAVGQTPIAITAATTATPSFTAPIVLVQDGDQLLTFNIEVTDNEGATHTDTVVITVQAVNANPVANAGAAQTVNEQTLVNLTAAASADSDGSIASYNWTHVPAVGQTPVSITGATTATPSFTAPIVLVQDGDQLLTFNVEVTDNEGATHNATVVITVQAVNTAPVANAGAAQTVNEQTLVNLTAAASADSDGSIVSYNWTQVVAVGQTALPITNANTAAPSFTAPIVLVQDGDQLLTFNVQVTDNEGATHTDTIVITVQAVNANPVANAGAAQTVNEQTLVNLSAALSADSDGSIASYNWTQVLAVGETPVAISAATTATPGFTAPIVLVQDGDQVLTFNVEVTDNEGATHNSTVAITVQAVNANPVANAGVAQTVNEQTVVNLTAAASSDSDGSIASYNWTQVVAVGQTALPIANANTAAPSFTAPVVLVQDGDQLLTFNVEVTDNEGATHNATVTITVQPVNANPVANAGVDQTVNEQTVVNLTAAASADSDGSIASYNWTQVVAVGQTPLAITGATTATPSFTAPTVLAQDGDQFLTFNVEVTDNEGATHVDTVVVTVQAVNALPTVNAGTDQTVDEQTTVSLTAMADDSDGTVVSYSWSQVSGMPVTLTDTASAILNFTAPTVLAPQGTQNLVFRVSVTDNENAVVTDDVMVTVNPVNAIPTVSVGLDQTIDEVTWLAITGTATDSDGSIISYQWTQVAGTLVDMLNANTATMGFNAPRLKTQETLTFRLTVSDNEIAEVFDEVNVVVNPVNTLPIADAGVDQTVAETLNVLLDGSASTDPDVDGSIVSYTWTQTAGLPVSLVNANTAIANFAAPSVYQDEVLSFRLDIVDDEGGTAFATTNVTLFSTNPDDDADGMLDVWEVQYFGNLSRDGTADDDADGATDLMEHGFGTDPLVSQGPGQPAIASPRATEVTELQPTLTVDNGVHHPSFTTTYEFEVYSDEAMSSLVTSTLAIAEGVTSTAWIVDVALSDNTRYYWRARSSGWVLKSDWVTSSFFVNTVNDAPATFNISAPQDGVWVNSFTPKLSVTNSSDVDEDRLTYRFEVYADQAMTSLVTSSLETVAGMNGVTSWTTDVSLLENTWYTWRAVVTDEHGLSTASDSANIFINTINDAPSVPVIISPLKGDEITTLSTDMIVENATDPEAETITYFFELDTVNTFDSVNKRSSTELPEGATETAWFVDNLSDNTRYYWRVKASDGRAQSNWRNGEFYVNTVNDVPGMPTLDNPTNNGWVGSMDPSLMVLPAIDLDEDTLSYEFEVYQSNRLGNDGVLLATTVSNTAYWQLTPVLPQDGWYKWRARAIDEHGLMSAWTNSALFYADSDGVNDAPRIKLDPLQRIRKRKKKFCDLPTRIEHRKFSWKHKNYAQTYKDKCREFVTIRWTDHDPDSNAFIKLFYSNTNTGQGGTLIKKGLREDPDHRKDQYRWDVTDLPDGVYFVYAVINDGTTRKVRYSPNAIVVGDGAGQPYMEFTNKQRKGAYSDTLTIKWADIDFDSNANIALYYDTDKRGFDGTLIVDGLTEDLDKKSDRYSWDITTMPPGRYFIYGVIQDETQTLRIYSPVRYKITVP